MSFNGTSMFAAGRRDRVVVRAADVLLRLTSKTYRRKLADLLLVGVMALPAKSPEPSPNAARGPERSAEGGGSAEASS